MSALEPSAPNIGLANLLGGAPSLSLSIVFLSCLQVVGLMIVSIASTIRHCLIVTADAGAAPNARWHTAMFAAGVGQGLPQEGGAPGDGVSRAPCLAHILCLADPPICLLLCGIQFALACRSNDLAEGNPGGCWWTMMPWCTVAAGTVIYCCWCGSCCASCSNNTPLAPLGAAQCHLCSIKLMHTRYAISLIAWQASSMCKLPAADSDQEHSGHLTVHLPQC